MIKAGQGPACQWYPTLRPQPWCLLVRRSQSPRPAEAAEGRGARPVGSGALSGASGRAEVFNGSAAITGGVRVARSVSDKGIPVAVGRRSKRRSTSRSMAGVTAAEVVVSDAGVNTRWQTERVARARLHQLSPVLLRQCLFPQLDL